MTSGLPRRMDEVEMLKSNILNYLITTVGATLATAAYACGVGHGTVYQWKSADEEFNKNISWARKINRELTNDFVEGKLLTLIREGHPATTIFYAKCRMKDRGYIDKAPMVMAVPENDKANAPTRIEFTLDFHSPEHDDDAGLQTAEVIPQAE